MDDKAPDWMTRNADGSVTVKLRRAASISGAATNALTMREPTVEDQIAAGAGNSKADTATMEVALFANLCMVQPEAIRGLTLHDYGRLQRAFADFLRD